MTDGRSPPARFEYRVFATRLEGVRNRLAEEFEEHPEAGRVRSAETYLCGLRLDRNVKVRSDALEIKALRETRRSLERWEPAGRHRFPLDAAWVERTLADHLGVGRLATTGSACTLDALLFEIVDSHPDLVSVPVHKDRRRFASGSVLAEFARLQIDGHPLQTAAVEGVDPDAVASRVRSLGLDRWANTSYVRLLDGLRRLTDARAARREASEPSETSET